MSWGAGHIAVDWGTTNRRAWRVGPDSAVLDQFQDDQGLMAVPPGGFDAAAAAIRERLGDLPMLLAGMVGSKRGWREAPYVPCPADPAALAEAIRWVEPGRTGIVPGVCQASPADVMRGEEVQVFGAIAAGLLAPDALVCHPGTHAKWIVVEDGRITAFRTLMTGELFALLRRHSILADLLGGEAHPGAAFAAGVDEALAGGELLRGLFAIRARHLLGQGGEEGASFASGLLIGHDVRAGLVLAPAAMVTLIGRPDLRALYARAIDRAGRRSADIDDGAAFRAGIARIAALLP